MLRTPDVQNKGSLQSPSELGYGVHFSGLQLRKEYCGGGGNPLLKLKKCLSPDATKHQILTRSRMWRWGAGPCQLCALVGVAEGPSHTTNPDEINPGWTRDDNDRHENPLCVQRMSTRITREHSNESTIWPEKPWILHHSLREARLVRRASRSGGLRGCRKCPLRHIVMIHARRLGSPGSKRQDQGLFLENLQGPVTPLHPP